MPRAPLLALLVALAIPSISAIARADETTLAQLITPPKARYPEGAHGAATVELEIVIDADGLPHDVKIIEGLPPFSLAALAASAEYRFTPATRNGKPIAAKLRARIEFTEPEITPAVTPPPTAPPAKIDPPSVPVEAPPKKTDVTAPIEIVIEGDRVLPAHDAEKTSFDKLTLRRVPGAFGDAFRVVEVLPGVTPFASGLPYFFVRGATPSSSGYFVDDIHIPFLFHVGAGPAVISPALVDHVDFFPGGFPARYGHFIGGVVAAATPDQAPRAHAEATLRLFDAGGFVEAPLLDGRVSVFGGGRYSYTAPLLSLVAPDLRLSYWDYQAGARVRLSDGSRLSLLVFGSDDYLGKKDDFGEEKELFGAAFHRAQLRLERGDDTTARARLALTLGLDRSGLSTQGDTVTPSVGLRSDVEVPITDGLRARGGLEISAERFDFSSQEDPNDSDFHHQIIASFASRTRALTGVYLDAKITPFPSLEVIPGLRLDGYFEESKGTVAPDPRLSIRYRVSSRVTSVSTFGISHQWPTIVVPIPGLEPRVQGGGLQRVIGESQGFEVQLPESVTASATVYHHAFDGLTDLLATCSAAVDVCKLTDRAGGRSLGLEFRIARPLSQTVGGFFSYTLSRTERGFEGKTFVSDLDRTHVLHGALGVALGRGFHAGARITAYSGRPYSLLAFDDAVNPTHPTLVGLRNALRRPWFFRLDARLEKSFRVGEHGYLSLVLEAMNATLSKETVDFDCRIADFSSDTSSLHCDGQEIGPIFLPSLGITGVFE